MPKYPPFLDGPGERPEFNVDPFREAMRQAFADTGAFNEKVQRERQFVIDNRGEEAVFTDGPFVETKEYLAGFWIIEAPNLDVALTLAAEGSKACNRKVEVRPFASE